MNTKLDELLHNAIDLHRHCYPEISLKLGMRNDDCESLKLARDVGMRAFSHRHGCGPNYPGSHPQISVLIPDLMIPYR